MVALSVKGRHVDVADGATLLQAARAADVHKPKPCHYPGLPARAVCRLCLVEVAGVHHPQPACRTHARDVDVVQTDTAALQAFRQADTEWLLARHPNDCMQCEVNGDCKLQSLSRLIGSVPCGLEEVAAFLIDEQVAYMTDGLPKFMVGSGGGLSDQRLVNRRHCPP